mgnify:CR=1 FL=1
MKEQVKILQSELEKVQEEIAVLQKAVDYEPDYGLGQGDPAVTRREVDRALLERLNRRVEKLAGAIVEIDEGKYGICEQCGNQIHPDRLAVLPDTKICARCARAG